MKASIKFGQAHRVHLRSQSHTQGQRYAPEPRSCMTQPGHSLPIPRMAPSTGNTSAKACRFARWRLLRVGAVEVSHDAFEVGFGEVAGCQAGDGEGVGVVDAGQAAGLAG